MNMKSNHIKLILNEIQNLESLSHNEKVNRQLETIRLHFLMLEEINKELMHKNKMHEEQMRDLLDMMQKYHEAKQMPHSMTNTKLRVIQ